MVIDERSCRLAEMDNLKRGSKKGKEEIRFEELLRILVD